MCARFKNCTLCIIKPHVIMSGMLFSLSLQLVALQHFCDISLIETFKDIINTTCTGCGGAMLSRIQQKFDVTALELARFNRHAAADFLEGYRGICPDFFVLLLTLSFVLPHLIAR